MPGDVLIALAQWAGQTVASAAVTDVWESVRHKFALLLGRGDPKRAEASERWLTETHEQLTAAVGGELESARAYQQQRWQGRFADLLDEDPAIEAELRALVEEFQAQLPAGVVSAGDHAVLDKMLSQSRAELRPERPTPSGAPRDESEELAIGRGGTSEAGHTALSEAIAQSLQQARSTVDVAISGLAEVAGKLDLPETTANLRQAKKDLWSDAFKLMVMGRFKNGKSTLVNALLGATTHPVAALGYKGPMMVDDLPATATLTGIRYAEEPYVRVWGFDGEAQAWSFARYMHE
jgi:hypothetical protein